MATLNRAEIIGRLGANPETRYTQNGLAVVNLSVATSEFSGKGEDRQERPEWHRVVAFGGTAEVVGKYLAKGQLVYIEGRLQTRKWDDKDGITRWSTEIVANNVQFLESKGASSEAHQRPTPPQQERPTQQKTESPAMPEGNDDFPF